MAQLNINPNVINISVSQAGPGIGNYNTSNLGLFSTEIPAESFGNLGYAFYVSPTQVGIDFGTTSKTYAMAEAVFSQQPNILTGGGQLVVILLGVATEKLAFSGVAASGAFEITWGSAGTTTSLPYTSSASAIQLALQAIPGLSEVTVSGSIASEQLLIQMVGVYGAAPVAFTVTTNSLETSGSTPITITITTPTAGVSLASAITTSQSLVQYFGVAATANLAEIGQTDLLAAAAAIQPLNKIGFFVSNQSADIQPGGMIDLLRTESYTQSRGLYYGDSSETNDLNFLASYAGLALSTNFSGNNTTQTMHLKTLIGVNPDPTITQTILNAALLAGADTYVSLQGVPAVFTSGANMYYDQVYNLQWMVGALQVAGFNYLAQSSTKIPQTEGGMDGLKGAYRAVMEQAVTNQYLAPGAWNSSTTFGNPGLLIANIAQLGYYIYSQPISQQSQTNRAARQTPLVQIAAKQAGAIQESTVIVNVNA